jgi:hypothetical protein
MTVTVTTTVSTTPSISGALLTLIVTHMRHTVPTHSCYVLQQYNHNTALMRLKTSQHGGTSSSLKLSRTSPLFLPIPWCVGARWMRLEEMISTEQRKEQCSAE